MSRYRHELPPVELVEAVAHECALAYTADRGWHLIPPAVLADEYGTDDLDAVADFTDALEIALSQTTRHDDDQEVRA